MGQALIIKDISDFDEEEALGFIEQIRKRRLEAYEAYKRALTIRNREKVAKIREAYSQQLRLLDKDLEALLKRAETAEKRVRKMRALQIEFAPLNEEIKHVEGT